MPPIVDNEQRPPGRPRRIRLLFSFAPLGLWVALSGLFGGVVGLGGFTLSYAQGLSYLSSDPRACANCHIMRDVFDGWNRGSHKAVATCNDCHTPHELIPKYAVKALDGVRHSVAFTVGGFPEPVQIGPFDRNIAYNNCLRCHGDLVAAISHAGEKNPTDCLRCHSDVGHSY